MNRSRSASRGSKPARADAKVSKMRRVAALSRLLAGGNSAVAGGGRGRGLLQTSFGHSVFDAVSELRARRGAGGLTAGLPDLGEVRATLRGLGAPLHGGVPGAELLHLNRDMTEPAVDGHQPGRQIPFAVTQRGFANRGGTGGVRREIRCPGKIPSTNFRIFSVIVVVVVCAVEPQHRSSKLIDVWGLVARCHQDLCSAFSCSSACRLRFSSTSTCHFSLAAVVSISISKRSVISGETSATST